MRSKVRIFLAAALITSGLGLGLSATPAAAVCIENPVDGTCIPCPSVPDRLDDHIEIYCLA